MLELCLLLMLPIHCRTGSLERILKNRQQQQQIHCRTGSLESGDGSVDGPLSDGSVDGPLSIHCRTGSLEK